MIRKQLESLNFSQKKILGLELGLALFCISVFFYFTVPKGVLWLFLVFLPIAFVPFLATFAYYKGFRRTSIAAILSIVVSPLLGLLILWLDASSEGGGLFLGILLLFSLTISAIGPFVIFAASLILHYYRERTSEIS